jgi:hypothetical protein
MLELEYQVMYFFFDLVPVNEIIFKTKMFIFASDFNQEKM